MTKIGWVKNPDGSQGITINSKTGCLNHTSEGLCLGGLFPCYAYKLAKGRLRTRYQANWNFPPSIDVHEAIGDTFYPRWWPERLDKIRGFKKPTGIFLDDMSDWMGDYWPEKWTRQELQVMRDCPQHRFYTLTKQPQNLIKFSPFPENCWVGVTATGFKAFNNALDKLKCVQAKVKYISIEPLLEAIPFNMERLAYCGINWLIIGAQTKPYKPPEIEWVREIVEAADRAGVKVFLKDNLKPLLLPIHSLVPEELPFYEKRLWHAGGMWELRQEIP